MSGRVFSCEDRDDGAEAPRRATDCAILCLISTSSCSLESESGAIGCCSRAAGAKDQMLLSLLSSINISVPARRTMRERTEQSAVVVRYLLLLDDVDEMPKDKEM